jgi:hypothetical protein
MQHSQSVKQDIRKSKDIYCKTITLKLKGTETTRRTPLNTERGLVRMKSYIYASGSKSDIIVDTLTLQGTINS